MHSLLFRCYPGPSPSNYSIVRISQVVTIRNVGHTWNLILASNQHFATQNIRIFHQTNILHETAPISNWNVPASKTHPTSLGRKHQLNGSWSLLSLSSPPSMKSGVWSVITKLEGFQPRVGLTQMRPIRLASFIGRLFLALNRQQSCSNSVGVKYMLIQPPP